MIRSFVSLALLLVLAGPSFAQQASVFEPERVARARTFHRANALGENGRTMDCITTLNHAVRLLYEDPMVPVGSQIDRTMAALAGAGLAGSPRVIEFNDERGRLTYGVAAPHSLRESVWDTALAMTRGARGWSVLGLSLMDGYHSILLYVDTTSTPTIYWADQWSSNEGFRQHTKESLDEEVRRLTTAWWTPQRRFKTRTTLWRLTPSDRSRVATVNSTTLNVRAEPSTTAPILATARRGDRFRVLSQRGLWMEVELADGTTGWLHTAYLSHSRTTPPPRASVTAADPAPAAPATPPATTSGLVGGMDR
ncbi:MAG: SH3 domain-containing protein [Planctomycetes bacterium]|nr:SH3 domain-containing protein [Planctomycetota bacterium]